MGYRFQVKLKSIIANGEIGKTLADTGEINHCQRRQKVGLELQNRCSATAEQFRLDCIRSDTLIFEDGTLIVRVCLCSFTGSQTNWTGLAGVKLDFTGHEKIR
jgi:hypothetical protein